MCSDLKMLKLWQANWRRNNSIDSSELATTAPVMTAQLTVRWMRWTTGTSRTIPSPGWGITWRPVAGGARMTRGAGGSNPARRWWRLSRGPRNAWSPIPNCFLLTCTRRWHPVWTSRENPSGGMCSSTKSTTQLICMKNNSHWRDVIWWKWVTIETGRNCCTPLTVFIKL